MRIKDASSLHAKPHICNTIFHAFQNLYKLNHMNWEISRLFLKPLVMLKHFLNYKQIFNCRNKSERTIKHWKSFSQSPRVVWRVSSYIFSLFIWSRERMTSVYMWREIARYSCSFSVSSHFEERVGKFSRFLFQLQMIVPSGLLKIVSCARRGKCEKFKFLSRIFIYVMRSENLINLWKLWKIQVN